MIRKSRLIVEIVVVGLCVIPTLAAEGRIAIAAPTVIGPGAEGHYVVTRDIFAVAGSPAIEILPNTGAVEIDLNGFSLYGNNALTILATQASSLTIRNGTVTRHGGISAGGVKADDCPEVIIDNLRILAIDGAPIFLSEPRNFLIRGNVIDSATGDGILVDGSVPGALPVQGTIEGNLVRDCPVGITLFRGSSVAIRGNRVKETFGGGGMLVIDCTGCSIEDNTVDAVQGSGMGLSSMSGGTIRSNTVTGSTDHGISLSSDGNLVLNNVCASNGENGLHVAGNQNHIEGNVLYANGTGSGPANWGLYLEGENNTYRGNTAWGNPGPAADCPGLPATSDFCDETGTNISPFNQPAAGLAGDNVMPTLL